MPGWFTIKPQRVKYANFSVNKDGVLERPNPSWSNAILDNTRPHHLEPWNVEKVSITGKAIEVRQHAESYPQYDETKGPRVLAVDEFSWSVLFKPSSMKDIHVREYKAPATVKTQQPSTFIELGFKYEGLPESKDSTQAKTVPEEAAMDDAGETEATGAEVDEEVEAGEIEGGEVEGGEVEGEDAEGGEAEGEEADEGAEEEQEEEMEVTPLNPDEFDLAKLFAGPNNFKDLEVRIAFMRSPAKTGRWQWHWPAVFRMLQGLEGYTPQTSKSETQRRHGLSLDEWMSNFGNKNHAFIADPQRDGTTRWKLRAEMYVFDRLCTLRDTDYFPFFKREATTAAFAHEHCRPRIWGSSSETSGCHSHHGTNTGRTFPGSKGTNLGGDRCRRGRVGAGGRTS